jgi:very-short-patch-repair endonuclease
MASISNRASQTTAIANVGAKQEGVVSRRQLEAHGLSRGQIERWILEGRLHPVFRTVYALGHRNLGPRARIRAASLACPGGVISHRSAAALLGIGKVAPVVVDLIPTDQRGRQIDGIRSHRVAFPVRNELVRVHGIVCTNVARTAVDLAGVYGEDGLRETFERAAAKRVPDLVAIEKVIEVGGKRRGAPALRRVIQDWRPVAETARYATVRSLFEAKLLPLVAAANLPMPKINAPIRTAERILEVDLLWPDERFVIKADSRIHHATEVAFERDRKRDLDLMEVHYKVLRVTWRQVEREPNKVFAVVRSELERRRSAASNGAAA